MTETSTPHRRYNPLLKEWILVSPHRSKRPWQGAEETGTSHSLPSYDEKCYLCPGNTRINGERNPQYSGVFVFKNDFAAVLEEKSSFSESSLNGIIRAGNESGICKVICFSPRHDLTLPQLSVTQIKEVIETWGNETEELRKEREINHVMIFENKGAVMGCSNPHPHGQIWATNSVPTIPAKMIASQKEYYSSHSSSLLQDYLNWEIEEDKRVILKNQNWVSLVPYWAAWPFETMILPRRRISSISSLSEEEKESWASILKEHTAIYDRLFKVSFPYSMGVYQSPLDGEDYSFLSLFQIFFPPLLRSATVKKFMVGYEMCAEPQRDLTPEDAAEKLRSLLS